MIRNDFIYELDIDIDLGYISKLVFKNQFKPSLHLNSQQDKAKHHRLVSDDEYMMSLKKKYPLLGDYYNIYTLLRGQGIPLHIDAGRFCALNIPIQGTEDTDTIFYETLGDVQTEYSQRYVYNLVQSPVKELFRHTLLRPVLINNSIPHKVINRKQVDRISLSWSFSKPTTFKEAKELFQ
jgi:hypothetical protein